MIDGQEVAYRMQTLAGQSLRIAEHERRGDVRSMNVIAELRHGKDRLPLNEGGTAWTIPFEPPYTRSKRGLWFRDHRRACKVNEGRQSGMGLQPAHFRHVRGGAQTGATISRTSSRARAMKGNRCISSFAYGMTTKLNRH